MNGASTDINEEAIDRYHPQSNIDPLDSIRVEDEGTRSAVLTITPSMPIPKPILKNLGSAIPSLRTRQNSIQGLHEDSTAVFDQLQNHFTQPASPFVTAPSSQQRKRSVHFVRPDNGDDRYTTSYHSEPWSYNGSTFPVQVLPERQSAVLFRQYPFDTTPTLISAKMPKIYLERIFSGRHVADENLDQYEEMVECFWAPIYDPDYMVTSIEGEAHAKH